MPSTPLSGVRSSWLTLVTNSDFTRAASSAASRALTSTSMFWIATTTPATSPEERRHGCADQRTNMRAPSSNETVSSSRVTTSPCSARATPSRQFSGMRGKRSHSWLCATHRSSRSRMAIATGAWVTTSRSCCRSCSSACSAALRSVMSRATAWMPSTRPPSRMSWTFCPIHSSRPSRATATNSS